MTKVLQRHSDVNYAITHAIRVLDSQGLRTATYSHHSHAWPKQPRIRDLLVVLVGPACLNLDDISRFTNTPMLLIRQFGRAVSGAEELSLLQLSNCPIVQLSNCPQFSLTAQRNVSNRLVQKLPNIFQAYYSHSYFKMSLPKNSISKALQLDKSAPLFPKKIPAFMHINIQEPIAHLLASLPAEFFRIR